MHILVAFPHDAKIISFFPEINVFGSSLNKIHRNAHILRLKMQISFRNVHFCFHLKQQNRYLWVIIVCGYFSVIRSFTWPNYPSDSYSYHKTSLSVSFGCWHLSGILLSPLHFTVYTVAWQRQFESQWVFNTNLCILSGWKVKYQPFSLRVY